MRRNSYAGTFVLLLATILTFGLSSASAQTYLFNQAVFATGSVPEALAAADFNGDGKLDLVTVNNGDATVSILLGNGDGTFEPHVDYAVGANPAWVAVADFNGDGHLDLAVVNSTDATVTILLGNGDGTFAPGPEAPFLTGSSATADPVSVAAADLNGDKKVDLVVANFNENKVAVFLGNGDGSFQNPVEYTTGSEPHSVAIGDYNNDGIPDLITADESPNTVSILIGNGDGTFQANLDYGTGPGPVQVVTGDFNNDGKLDAATADIKTNEASVLVGTGTATGNGVFPHQEHYFDLAESTGVAVGDFTGQGSLDAVYSSPQANAVMVYTGDGTGAICCEVDYAVGISGGNFNTVITADFNGDGKLDLAVVNPADNTVSILLGNGDTTFATKKGVATTSQNPASVAVADFNGDGNLDMASADVSGTQISVFFGNGDGTFGTEVPYAAGTNPQYIVAADFNGDGKPDLAVVNQADNTVGIFINNGSGGFASQVTYPVGHGPVALVAGDFNGDHIADLAVANSTDSTITILLGNGDGTFAVQSLVYSAVASPVWIAAADFNGDGILDLVTADMLGDEVSVLLGTGNVVSLFPSHVEYSTGTGSTPVAVTAGDFNGDGCADIATANFLNSSVTISPNGASVLVNNCDKSGTFKAHVDYATGLEPLSITSGDLNGDGKLDLVLGNASTHLNAASVLFGNGDGTFQPHQEYLVGINPTGKQQGVALGDFNNDGALDLAATSSSANQIVVMLNDAMIALFPSSLTFAAQLINTTSAAQTISVTNRGSIPLAISGITTTSGYAVSSSCPSSLVIGGSCSISITFTPTATGSVAGNLTITDNSLTSPHVLTLSGTGTAPTAGLAPTTLTFSSQAVGTTSAATPITLSNTGTGTLNITSISTTAQFTETNTCGNSVASGLGCTISVTFTPTGPGTQTGTLTITDNAPNSPQLVSLSGTGSGPAVSLAPSSVTFSAQPEGSTSAAQTVTLTNTGNATLSITSITASQAFGQTNTCGTSVGASAKCTISVTFTPTASGTQTGTLTVTDSASGSPHIVALTGTGTTSPFVSLSQSSLGFPTVNVGSSSTPMTITLTNTGKTALTINSGGLTLGGANPGDFSLTPASTCPISPSTLASGASCTISVTFKPVAAGTRAASLTITDNAANNPQTVTLTGAGNAAPVVSLSPTSLDFGSQTIGAASAAKTVTLTNTGNADLTISSITASGNFSESPSLTDGCGTTVNAGASCMISVTFKPLTANSLTGTLTVNDNAGTSPQTAALSGSGQGATVGLAPTTLVFTQGVLVNSKSNPQTVTLTNTGNATLTLQSIAMTGASAAEFTETNTCGSTVAAGASCAISLIFAPTAGGNQAATLTVTDDAFGSPQSLAVSGAGASFSVAGPTTATTVAAGQPAIFTVTMTPVGGFNQSVSLSCSDSIAASTCTVTPNSLTLNAPNVTNAMVTVSTTARSAAPTAPRMPSGPGPWIWIAVGALLALAAGTAKRTRRTRWALGAALVVVLAWAACGGGGSSAPPAPNGTPAGKYTVTVTASSAGLSATSTTLNVTVE